MADVWLEKTEIWLAASFVLPPPMSQFQGKYKKGFSGHSFKGTVGVEIPIRAYCRKKPEADGMRSLPQKAYDYATVLMLTRRFILCPLLCMSEQIRTYFLKETWPTFWVYPWNWIQDLRCLQLSQKNVNFYFRSGHLSYLFTFDWHHRIADFLEIFVRCLSSVPNTSTM